MERYVAVKFRGQQCRWAFASNNLIKMCLLLVVLLKGGLASAQDTPARDRLQFSWETVPIYQQLCNPNATLGSAWPEERMKFLARYPLITLEHCQGYYSISSGQAMEDYFQSAAKQLKSQSPNTTVLFYSNSVGGLTYYRWCAEGFQTHPEWRLRNDDNSTLCRSGGGHMLPQYHGYDWDQRQPAVQHWWASLCLNLTNSPGSQLDGCSIDTAHTCLKGKQNLAGFERSRQAAVTLAQTLAGQGKIVGAVGARETSGVQLSQVYTFSPTMQSMEWLQNMKHAGMIAEAHAQTNFGEKGDHVNASLAAFLIGAYEKSYFAFSTNPGAGYSPFCDGTAPSWCYGMGWSEDFSKPLGKPLGDAVTDKSGKRFHRQFAAGTNVTLDLQEGSCEIAWADGSITTCQKFDASEHRHWEYK